MTSYIIIGAGGTASHLIPALRRMLATEDIVHIWDADRVEDKNLQRQMFEDHEVGALKAQVYEDRYGFQFVAHNEFVGEDNVAKVIEEGDTVFICADNMAVRRVIAAHVNTLENVTLINGGNEMFTGSSQVFIRRAGQNLTPNITYHAPEINREDPDMASLSCAEIAVLPGGEQTMLANFQVAALMLSHYWQAANLGPIVSWADRQPTKTTFDLNAGTFQGSDVRMQGEDWR